METKIFNDFRTLIQNKSGIALKESKVTLLSARVSRRMREIGISSHKEYYNIVVEDDSGSEMTMLIDAISTNVTHFFRENEHFIFLNKIFKEWQEQGQRKFRIWSAASSTGEEPYSIAMSLNSEFNTQIDVKILATDISTRVLERCKQGVYSGETLNKVPNALKSKYFSPVEMGGERKYLISNDIKKYVAFRWLNLSQPPFPMKGPLDVVFCRNVMIYFDNDVKEKLLGEVFRLLKPGGYLMVGHSESISGLSTGFKPLKPSIYIKS